MSIAPFCHPARKTSPVRTAAVCVWFALCCPGGFIAASAPPVEVLDEIVELPAVSVTSDRVLPKPESWLYARIDGFEVLSSVSAAESGRLLDDFQMFRQALAVVRPFAMEPLPPATLFLCGRADQVAEISPAGRETRHLPLGWSASDGERAALVVNLGVKTYEPEDISDLVRYLPDFVRGVFQVLAIEPERQLRRTLLQLEAGRNGSMPPWLVEGIIQVCLDMDVAPRTVRYGKVDGTKGAPPAPAGGATGDVTGAASGATDGDTMIGALISGRNSLQSSDVPWGNEGEAVSRLDTTVGDLPFHMVLANRPMLPLEEFFAVAPDDRRAVNPLADSLWPKQAYAFVHMCQFRDDGKFREPFARFVERLAREPRSERLFRECFGRSHQEMSEELRRYVRHPRHVFRNLRFAPGHELTAAHATFRAATQAEIARIKGDAQRLAGRHEEALLTYRVALARGERDPALLAALGVAEYEVGRPERARSLLEAVAKPGVDRPSMWITLARLRLEEGRAGPADAGRLSAAQLAAVLAPLLKARASPPALPDTYRLMAEAWELAAETPAVAHVHLVGEGAMRFPEDADLVLRTARLYVTAGDSDAAAEVARMGLRFARDSETRERFTAFLATVSVSTATPGAAAP